MSDNAVKGGGGPEQHPASLGLKEALAELNEFLSVRLAKVKADAEEARQDLEAVKDLRVSIQRKVEELERSYHTTVQNVTRIANEYERLDALRERASNAMALKPPETPKAPRRAIRAIKDIPRLRQELLSASTEIETQEVVSGVYFLLDGSEVVYVGQSINVLQRVVTHAGEGAKQFNRWCYIEVERRKLDEIENFYIALLRPKYNIRGKPVLLAQNDPTLAREVAA